MVELDNIQLRAAESDASLTIVTGAPGTGKTHLLTRRFAHLITSRAVPLSGILVLTFSSASAARLRREIEAMIHRSYDELWVHTAPSFANAVLAEFASTAAGLRQPTFVSPFREYLLIKEILCREQKALRSDIKAIAHKSGLAREISDFLGLLKQHLIGEADFSRAAGNLSGRVSDIARIYSAREKFMEQENWVGVRDVIGKTLDLFQAHPELLAQYHEKFRHILVDEFQEVDSAQLRFISVLASEQTSLFVTGDEEQRIYRFRGGSVGQFRSVAAGEKSVERFHLEKNYRLASGPGKASRNLIAHNHNVKARTEAGALGTDLVVMPCEDPVEQAYSLARSIKHEVLESASASPPITYSDFAVICRSTARSAVPIEEAFSYYGVPYVLYNSTSFYSHPIVRSTADFLRLLVNPDDDVILMRALRIPALGLDAVELSRIAGSGRSLQTGSLYETIRRTVIDGTDMGLDIRGAGVAQALKDFICYFENMREQASTSTYPSALIHSIMSKLFFGRILGNTDIAAGKRDARNLRLLSEVVADIEVVLSQLGGTCYLSDIAEYMEHAFAHFSEQQENNPADEPADGVRIMTVHQAKGMEFPFVFLVDMTEDNFPRLGRRSCLFDGESSNELAAALQTIKKAKGLPDEPLQFMLSPREQLKEERQLAYVAFTRATRRLTICYTRESHLSEIVQASPFIEEFIGQPVEMLEEKQASAPSDACALLAAALTRNEMESALRSCVRRLPAGAGGDDDLSSLVKSYGLDSHFIFTETPFEREPGRTPSLAGHRYSATQLAAFLSCPRRFFFESLLRIAPERPDDFGLGLLIHNILEAFHKEIRDFRGSRSVIESCLDKAFRTVWNGPSERAGSCSNTGFRRQFPLALQRAAVESRTKRILKRYTETELAQAADREIVSCEEFIEFLVGDYLFGAKIDRIDEVISGNLIIDYKTSSSGQMRPATIKKKFLNIEDKPDYAPQDFQLPLYLLAGRKAGYRPVELMYYWLAQEDSRGMFKKSSLTLSEDNPDCLSEKEVKVVEGSIVEVVKRIATGPFEPGPRSSYECARCSFTFVCNGGEEDGDENEQ